MSIFEDVRRGGLYVKRLKQWLRSDSRILSTLDTQSGWTVLATAVVAGFPEQVEALLESGAQADQRCRDGETALLLATWKAPVERPLMVQMLLRRLKRGSPAVDETFDGARNNTPLMFALKKYDDDSVRLLVQAGARLTSVRNNKGFNALEVAQNTGRRTLVQTLYPDREQSAFARISSGVVSFTRHIASWVDDRFAGFMQKRFGFRGQKSKSTEKKLRELKRTAAEPTPEEFVQSVDTYIKDTPVLETFFKDDKEFTQKMAKKLVDLASDPTSDLTTPEMLPKTIQVTMHQQVLYCDDSSSMTNRKGTAEGRWENQKALALRIARTTTRILPDNDGVALRFINQPTADMSLSLDLQGIEQGLNAATANGDTPIGTQLRRQILEPLVYGPLAQGTLRRPLLVSILTDGGPSEEDAGTLARTIIECGNKLVSKRYPRDCVKFLIGQIGSSKEAVGFLDTLRDNNAIASVSHIYAGRFDDKFRSFRDERKLDKWLVRTLFEPLAAAEVGNKK